MKKLVTVLMLSCLLACSGNESADSKPTDVDRTDNNDTSVKQNALPDTLQNNSDTTHL